MISNSLKSKLFQIIGEQLSVDDHQIQPTSRFVEDLGADSLDIVELVMEMEEEFNIEIPDEDVEKMVTVQDVSNYIEKLVAKEEG